MKMLVAAIAFAAITVSPALAQTRQPSAVAPGNFGAPVQYAPGAVIEGGQYIGSDPDPQVRLDLIRQGAYYQSGGNS